MNQSLSKLKKLINQKDLTYNWQNCELLKLQLIWYVSLISLVIIKQYTFSQTTPLNSIFSYLFNLPIKLLVIAYLIYLLLFTKNFSLAEVGLTTNNYLAELNLGLKLSLPLPILNIILINLQHQQLDFNQLFTPLIKITSFNQLISSFFYFTVLTLFTLIPALAEELFYRGIIYNFFKERLGLLGGALISSFYYSLATLELSFGFLFSNFLAGIISIYLYERNSNIFSAVIWQSFYQTTLILYIVGF
ncbi:MAG: CPBP family intramembrane glutamic endopeptidase [Bacillota bacterium]